MKKVISIVFALLFVMVVFACGGDDKPDTTLADAKSSLNIGFSSGDTAASVTKNVTLIPSIGEVSISWESDESATITSNGTVARPEASVGDKVVTLTATLSYKGETETKSFSLTVLALSAAANLKNVIFETSGGDVLPIQKVQSGNTASRPTEPKKEGFDFLNWYKDENFESLWDFDTDVVTSTVIIYAKWKKDYSGTIVELDPVIAKELKASFDFFYRYATNTNPSTTGFGLTRDRYPGSGNSSMAATGYALAALPVGVENGWITFEEGYERALGTLKTAQNLERHGGFYFHFMNTTTGAPSSSSEVSVIDSALFICGALVAGRFFGDEAESLSRQLYEEIDWNFYTNPGKQMFYMTYNPNTQRFDGAWDRNNEQMMMYFLGAGSPTYPQGANLYRTIKTEINKHKMGYTSTKNPSLSVAPHFVNWDGPLFTHQYAHAYIDFRNMVDYEGTNWFDNAVLATKAQILYAYDYSDVYKTYSMDSWGISACDGPFGYKAYGGGVSEKTPSNDGTVCAYGPLGSINYTPEESIRAAQTFASYPRFWNNEVGFVGAYNLGRYDGLHGFSDPWFASVAIGIDKGVTITMLENYRSNLIWNIFMDIDYIQNGARILGFETVA